MFLFTVYFTVIVAIRSVTIMYLQMLWAIEKEQLSQDVIHELFGYDGQFFTLSQIVLQLKEHCYNNKLKKKVLGLIYQHIKVYKKMYTDTSKK